MMAKSKPQDQAKKQGLPEAFKAAQFRPGQSGNPAGRPKGRSLLADLRNVLDGDTLGGKKTPGGITVRQFLVDRVVLHAAAGRSSYARLVFEYLLGRPKIRIEQKIESGDDAIDLPSHIVEAGIRGMLEAMGENTGPES